MPEPSGQCEHGGKTKAPSRGCARDPAPVARTPMLCSHPILTAAPQSLPSSHLLSPGPVAQTDPGPGNGSPATHGPLGDGSPAPAPTRWAKLSCGQLPSGLGEEGRPDRAVLPRQEVWGPQCGRCPPWSPGPQEATPSACFFLGVPREEATRAAGRSLQTVLRRAFLAGSFWGVPDQSFPAVRPLPATPHRRGRGFCPSPGQRSPCRVLRQPGRWTPRSSPLPLSCHLPTPVPSRHQPVSAGRAARKTNPPGSARGSEVGDCRHSKGWPAPDPQPPAPQLPVPSHPQHLPEDPQGGSGLQTG